MPEIDVLSDKEVVHFAEYYLGINASGASVAEITQLFLPVLLSVTCQPELVALIADTICYSLEQSSKPPIAFMLGLPGLLTMKQYTKQYNQKFWLVTTRDIILIPAGWKTHTVYYVFAREGVLVYCNRGAAYNNFSGCILSTYKPEKLTCGTLSNLREEDRREEIEFSRRSSLWPTLGVDFQEFGQWPQSSQKGKNCAFSGMKSAVLGIIYCYYYSKVSSKEITDVVRIAYKEIFNELIQLLYQRLKDISAKPNTAAWRAKECLRVMQQRAFQKTFDKAKFSNRYECAARAFGDLDIAARGQALSDLDAESLARFKLAHKEARQRVGLSRWGRDYANVTDWDDLLDYALDSHTLRGQRSTTFRVLEKLHYIRERDERDGKVTVGPGRLANSQIKGYFDRRLKRA